VLRVSLKREGTEKNERERAGSLIYLNFPAQFYQKKRCSGKQQLQPATVSQHLTKNTYYSGGRSILPFDRMSCSEYAASHQMWYWVFPSPANYVGCETCNASPAETARRRRQCGSACIRLLYFLYCSVNEEQPIAQKRCPGSCCSQYSKQQPLVASEVNNNFFSSRLSTVSCQA